MGMESPEEQLNWIFVDFPLSQVTPTAKLGVTSSQQCWHRAIPLVKQQFLNLGRLGMLTHEKKRQDCSHSLTDRIQENFKEVPKVLLK